MDGWEYLDPRDMNDQGMIVGSAWFTDPTKPEAEGESHGFLLVQLGFHPREDGINKASTRAPIQTIRGPGPAF